ncbi:hypothetical protein C0991_010839 [Blastosporella zonata]|nr:hypothetical protein C0991_010839 [Blastosporella zonata]
MLESHVKASEANEGSIKSKQGVVITDVQLPIRIDTYVAAVLIPVGNAVTKSARRTPRGESWEEADQLWNMQPTMRDQNQGQCQSSPELMADAWDPLRGKYQGLDFEKEERGGT